MSVKSVITLAIEEVPNMRSWNAHRHCIVSLSWALLLTSCSGGSQREGAYVDRIPMLPDTMTTRMIEPGVYGGRFVIGATSGPKTFNAIMSNETSTTDVIQRLFTALCDNKFFLAYVSAIYSG